MRPCAGCGTSGAIRGNPPAASTCLALSLGAVDGSDGPDLELRPGRVIEDKLATEQIGLPAFASADFGDQRVYFGVCDLGQPVRSPYPNPARVDLREMVRYQAQVRSARVIIGQASSAVGVNEKAFQFENAEPRDERGGVPATAMTLRNPPVLVDLLGRFVAELGSNSLLNLLGERTLVADDAGIVDACGGGYMQGTTYLSIELPFCEARRVR